MIVDNAGQEGAVIVGKLLEGDATSNIGYNAAVGGPPPPLPPPPGASRSAASSGHSARCPDETRVRCPTRQLTRRASYGLETHHFLLHNLIVGNEQLFRFQLTLQDERSTAAAPRVRAAPSVRAAICQRSIHIITSLLAPASQTLCWQNFAPEGYVCGSGGSGPRCGRTDGRTQTSHPLFGALLFAVRRFICGHVGTGGRAGLMRRVRRGCRAVRGPGEGGHHRPSEGGAHCAD